MVQKTSIAFRGGATAPLKPQTEVNIMQNIIEIYRLMCNADPTMQYLAGGYVVLMLISLIMIIVGWCKNQ